MRLIDADKGILRECKDKSRLCIYANVWNTCVDKPCEKGDPMTNREWLESLSDEERVIFYATQSTICEMCDYTDVCISEITSEKCSEGVERWLQAEHKEPKKELTQAQLCEAFELKFGKRRAISLDEIKSTIRGLFE